MKKRLELVANGDSLFWEVKVEGNRYEITSGEIGQAGATVGRSALDGEAALGVARKLAQARLAKGYVEVAAEEPPAQGWFERLERALLEAYKREILRCEKGGYRYIRLTANGERFALGLRHEDNSDYWETMETGFWGDWERAADVFLDDREAERDEWPQDLDACEELQAFLISAILGKVFLQLRGDKALKDHLGALTRIMIDADDSVNLPFGNTLPGDRQRAKAVKRLVADPKNVKLIRDLWKDKLKGPGAAFLRKLNITPSPSGDPERDRVGQAMKKAEELSKYYKDKQAIALLEPELEALINRRQTGDAGLIERACGLLAGYCKALKDYGRALSWYERGVGYHPYGDCALNLLATLKRNTRDYERLVAFGERHLEHARKNNREYRFHSLNYLAYGYAATGNETKAVAVYRDMAGLFKDAPGLMGRARGDLKEMADSDSEAGAIAREILGWFGK